MLKLVLASRNRKKIRELETLLAEISSYIQVLSLDDIGYTDEIVEDGTTFAENSRIKASVPASLGYIGIADDSGLVVDALNGAPGVYSARYSGEDATDEKNNKKLLAELANVPDERRTARFCTVVTCAFPDGTAWQFDGSVEGTILHEPDGDGGFGYDPLFYYAPFGKTFAALSADEKNSVSHRGKAMRAFAEKMKNYIMEKNNADK
ncbi:MAG: XTP/dITP diphosphatase [Ruminococcaceae bacterium]|nr:XTP/dITP diphosphatase [Oscillospiraceae bacterium]